MPIFGSWHWEALEEDRRRFQNCPAFLKLTLCLWFLGLNAIFIALMVINKDWNFIWWLLGLDLVSYLAFRKMIGWLGKI